ncbi:hypothetical protein C8R42DRAFT_717093 [Lentinula raphanica]|nr:hypothetical protein C8R42DRAFT_717093 [Lentinula raphanica]
MLGELEWIMALLTRSTKSLRMICIVANRGGLLETHSSGSVQAVKLLTGCVPASIGEHVFHVSPSLPIFKAHRESNFQDSISRSTHSSKLPPQLLDISKRWFGMFNSRNQTVHTIPLPRVPPPSTGNEPGIRVPDTEITRTGRPSEQFITDVVRQTVQADSLILADIGHPKVSVLREYYDKETGKLRGIHGFGADVVADTPERWTLHVSPTYRFRAMKTVHGKLRVEAKFQIDPLSTRGDPTAPDPTVAQLRITPDALKKKLEEALEKLSRSNIRSLESKVRRRSQNFSIENNMDYILAILKALQIDLPEIFGDELLGAGADLARVIEAVDDLRTKMKELGLDGTFSPSD